MFVSDYVNTKYKSIYEEAGVLYNKINQANPRKPDLRRTKEYRQWKNNIASAKNTPLIPIPREKKRKMVHTTHRDIPISANRQTSAEKPTQDKRIGMTMQLNIPLMWCQTMQAPKEIPGSDNDESRIDEGNQTEAVNPSAHDEVSGSDNDESRIDEGNQAETVNPSAHDEESGTDYHESIIDEGNQITFNPSIFDGISSEDMEKIIKDLQQDPNLKDIMDDVECQIEEEIVGLDVDIDVYDPLEEELQNIWG